MIAIWLSSPPAGYGKTTLHLLARKVVELEIVKTISRETVRQTLKKSHDKAKHRVLGDPSGMTCGVRDTHKNVLKTYEKPYESSQSVVCMNEQPVLLVNETRQVIPATKNHPWRVDYEYERNGTAPIFMFCEPFVRWRQATARERRTKFD